MSNETVYSHPFSKSPDLWPETWAAPFVQTMNPLSPVSPGTMNLMTPAAGAAAAMTAVGIGMAACAWGSMLGAMTGAMASGKAPVVPGFDSSVLFGFAGAWDESEPETGALNEKSSSAGAKAESAVRTVAADIESVVRDVEDTGRKLVEAVNEDFESAVSSTKLAPRPTPGGTPLVPPDKVAKSPAPAKTPDDTAAVEMKKPAGIKKPAAVDDLKKITGIGPKLEMVLNDLGIFTFAQVASWGAAEIAWIDDYLSFSGRIGRDKWIEQASALAGKPGAAKNG